MKKILLGLSVLVFTGCASIHSGVIQPSQVQFNSPNFSVIKSIEGEVQATYFLGIGGLLRGGLIKEAKRNMYRKHHFTENQIIITKLYFS